MKIKFPNAATALTKCTCLCILLFSRLYSVLLLFRSKVTALQQN